MSTATSIHKNEPVNTPAGYDGLRVRCAPVADDLWLAVIKADRVSDALATTITGCLLAIDGVRQVHFDALRGTVQILYDGGLGTVKTVDHVLGTAGWRCEKQAG